MKRYANYRKKNGLSLQPPKTKLGDTLVSAREAECKEQRQTLHVRERVTHAHTRIHHRQERAARDACFRAFEPKACSSTKGVYAP